MKPHTLKDILDAKEARRRRLAELPIDQKIDLIEKLHELGRTMIGARDGVQKGKARREKG
jgi:hypothetical protein